MKLNGVFDKLRWVGLGLVMSFLAACSTTSILDVQQENFHQWPVGIEGQTYAVAQYDQQDKDLEFASYVSLLRDQMWHTGLKEASNRQAANFEVKLTYGTEPMQKMVRDLSYDDDNFFWFYPTFGYGGWWYPYYSGYNVMMMPRSVVRQISYNRYNLTIVIKQNSTGKNVFQSKVITNSNRLALSQVMPFLMMAVFDDFPGNNGLIRNIQFDLNPKQEGQTPSAYTIKNISDNSINTVKFYSKSKPTR